MGASYSGTSPGQNLSADESSIGLFSMSENSSSCALLSQSKTQNSLEASLFQPQKFVVNPVSSRYYIQNPRDAIFHNNLCLPLISRDSGTNQQLISPPLVPYRAAYDHQSTFPVHNPNFNPPFLGRNATTACDKDHSGKLMDFPSMPGASSAGCQGSDYVKDGLSLTERLQLHQLSQELGIASNDADSGNSRIGEIFEAPQRLAIPITWVDSNRNNFSSIAGIDDCIHPSHRHTEPAAAHKQRIRWTTELHELFIDAINKLGGPESATPKGILMLMDVEGLNIYHVKSHLQKYRLAKNMPEIKQDKRILSSVGKKQLSASNDSDAPIKREEVIETLRLQIEVQKQLHEQLKAQKRLQLRIEQQGEYLRKLMEEHEKGGSSLFPIHDLPLFINTRPESEVPLLSLHPDTSAEQVESSTDSSSSQSKNKASIPIECEQSKCQKRLRQD